MPQSSGPLDDLPRQEARRWRLPLGDGLRRWLTARALGASRRLDLPPLTYSGRYSSWAAACRAAGSYADPALFEEELAAMRAVRAGRASHAVFGRPRTQLAFRWPLLASLMAIAGWQGAFAGRRLHVLDFGGGLGSVYDQHRTFLATLPALAWSIVEQPHFARAGSAEFATDRLAFFETVEAAAAARGDIDAAIFVASIGYLEDPLAALADLADRGVPYVLLIATQLTGAGEHVLRLQHMRAPYVVADVPIWFLSRPQLFAALDRWGYDTFADLGSGYLFRRRKGWPGQ